MAAALDHEIGSLVDCARLLVWKIFSTHFPYYQVEDQIACKDGNLSGVVFAKALLQQCNTGIEEMALQLERTLFYSGCCGNVSFASRVATLRPLRSCCDDVCNNLEKRSCELTREVPQILSSYSSVDVHPTRKLRLRLRQQNSKYVSSYSAPNRDTVEPHQQDVSFVRCERERLKSSICKLKSELKNKDMLIELIMGLVQDKCPRIYGIVQQYQHQLNNTGDKRKQRHIDKLERRIQSLEIENNGLKCAVKEKDLQLRKGQTRYEELKRENGEFAKSLISKDEQLTKVNEDKNILSRIDELETEATNFKQRLHLKDGEIMTIKKEQEELLTRNGELENEATGLKQKLDLKDEELMTIKKEQEELLTRIGELEKEATGFKQRLNLKEEEIFTIKKEEEELLTRNEQLTKEIKGLKQRIKKETEELLARTGELEKEVTGLKQRLNLSEEELFTTDKEKEELLTRNDELIKEVMGCKQKLDLRDEELTATEKEKEALLARSGELEKEVASFKQRLHLKDEELIAMKKERNELSRRNDELDKEALEVKQMRFLREEELIVIEKGSKELLARIHDLEKENTMFKHRLNFKEETLTAINQQKEELLTRLSQYTSAQLVHDNPNVADLSDLNRPTKLAEKLSELYDNEWTDGFEVLIENYQLTETDAIQQLLDILMDAYRYCTKTSNKQEKMIKQALVSPVADDAVEDQQRELNSVQLRSIFDLRKHTSHWSLKTVQKGFLDNVKISGQNSPDVKQLIKYIDQCAELCWHMVIRSPPLVFEAPASEGSEFDKTKYRFYQTSGMHLNFIVWPVLRLHEDGPLLSKGIAEAMKGAVTAELD